MKIKLIENKDEIKKICEYLNSFDLDYPNYKLWVKKCEKELIKGYKKGFYAEENGKIAGEIIFQPLKTDKEILEIKSLRISPKYLRKKIALNLFSYAEKFAEDFRFKKVQVDTHEDNEPVINFFINQGFKIIGKEALYQSNQIEVILSREVRGS